MIIGLSHLLERSLPYSCSYKYEKLNFLNILQEHDDIKYESSTCDDYSNFEFSSSTTIFEKVLERFSRQFIDPNLNLEPFEINELIQQINIKYK
jgi:hypothetical protein